MATKAQKTEARFFHARALAQDAWIRAREAWYDGQGIATIDALREEARKATARAVAARPWWREAWKVRGEP